VWIHRDALAALPEQPYSDAVKRFVETDPRIHAFSAVLRPFARFEIRPIGNHSPGSCIVSIELPGRRRAIILGDEYRNRSEWKAAASGGQDALARELAERESRGDLILTMHETPQTPDAKNASGPIIRLYPSHIPGP